MPPEKQIFDPDGDLTFILPSSSPKAKPSKKPRIVGVRNLSSCQYYPNITCILSVFTSLTQSRKRKCPAKATHIYMLVSSKHMSLASPVFKAMLTHPFQEVDALRNHGKVDIQLPEDDPVVFTIILDIIHGRGKRVPRVVPLPLLSRIAAAVDKYQLQEPGAVFADTWLSEAVEEIST